MDTNQHRTTSEPCRANAAPHNGHNDASALDGVKQRIAWCETALNIPMLVPLVGFVMRAWRESWPDPASSGSMVHEMSELADYIHKLQVKAGKGVAE